MTDTQRMQQLIRRIVTQDERAPYLPLSMREEARAIVASWPDPDLILARQVVAKDMPPSSSFADSVIAGERDSTSAVQFTLMGIKAARGQA